MDYFLWGFVKVHAYKNNPKTIQEPKNNIQRVIGAIEPQMYENMLKNFDKRLTACKAARAVIE